SQDTVRTPHPENIPGESRFFITSLAWLSVAIPENKQCPALEVRTLHWRLSPSSANANVESSSDQKAAPNLLRSSSAFTHCSSASDKWPSSAATAAIPVRAA